MAPIHELRIMYIMLNYGLPAALRCNLSRLIQIGSVPIILRPAIPFDSGTYKLIVRLRQSWCQFTEIATRIVELISRRLRTVPKILRLVYLSLNTRMAASELLD